MKPERGLTSWAGRAAGAIGLVTALLYLALIVGEGGNRLAESIVWFTIMAGAGLSAWFADRAAPTTGRRLMRAAFVGFFVLGVLSILTIGVLYLIASVLAVIALAGRSPDPAPVSNGDQGRSGP